MATWTLGEVLKQPLLPSNATVRPVNSRSTKNLPDDFQSFQPQQSGIRLLHQFAQIYGNTTSPPLPPATDLNLMSKVEVKAACELRLVNWIVTCLSTTGAGNRPVKVLRDTGGLPRIVNPGNFPDLKVDFTFIHGTHLEQDRVAAVLQTKAVGALKPRFWRGMDRPTLDDEKLAKEARAYAHLWNTRIVMFYDGKILVRLRFLGNPLETVPETWVIEHGQENQVSMRQVVLDAICQGLSAKVPNWM